MDFALSSMLGLLFLQGNELLFYGGMASLILEAEHIMFDESPELACKIPRSRASSSQVSRAEATSSENTFH
jgi:hypothetical protein